METKKEELSGKIGLKDYSKKDESIFEPKFNYQFVVYMESIPTWAIHTVKRPKAVVKEGKYAYSNLVLQMYDAIVPSISQKISDFIRNGKTVFDEIKLDILGPIGDVVEQWRYTNCKVEEISYSDLDWSVSNPIQIQITFSFDEAIHEF